MSYPIETAAARAGVAESAARTYVRLGLVDPDGTGTFSDAEVRRMQVLDMLEKAGLPIEGLAELARQGVVSFDFIEGVGQYVFVPLSDRTFADMAASTGLPFETLAAIRESLGGEPPEPEDRMGEDELTVLSLAEFQHSLQFRPHAIEQGLRVYGESLRRIAETEAEWFRSEIARPMLARGGSVDELATYSSEISSQLSMHTDAAVLAIYHRQQRHAWSVNIIDGLATALEEAGIHRRDQRTPAISFLDLTGYTRLTEERGDTAAADLAEGVRRIVERHAVARGGRAVKWLGDGVMLHFPAPGSAVAAGVDMVAALDEAGMASAHVGIDAGPVLFREGDYYGRTVNVAARLSDFARPGEVLVTQSVVDLVDEPGVSFTEIGPVEVRGVVERLTLYSASGAAGDLV